MFKVLWKDENIVFSWPERVVLSYQVIVIEKCQILFEDSNLADVTSP